MEKEFLDAHNRYRQRHGVPPLSLNGGLCSSAQNWADHLLSIKSLKHSSTKDGENLYYFYSSTHKKLHSADVVHNWYREIYDYHFNKPGFTCEAGHFTQVVWKATRQVGLGVATDGRAVYVVGRYHPPGNVTNPRSFQENVLPPGPSNWASGPTKEPSDSGDPDRDREMFLGAFLREANARRTAHGALPLFLSFPLCYQAQQWADILLENPPLRTSSSKHGQNIWSKTGPPGTTVTGEEVIEAWYKQKQNYDFHQPGFRLSASQFTQLVWCGSEEVGVGVARASSNTKVIVVAFFDPAGNIANRGHCAQNVLPEVSKVNSGPLKDVTDKLKGLAVGVKNCPAAMDSEFSHALLQTVNQYRSEHGVEPLSLSPALCKEAQDWSTHMLSTRIIKNSNKGHGENIYYRTGSSLAPPTGSEVAESWYKGIEKYNFSMPGFQEGTGNFTQIVWGASKEVGAGIATDGCGMFVAVAFFDPPGNVTNHGFFRDNVKGKGSRR